MNNYLTREKNKNSIHALAAKIYIDEFINGSHGKQHREYKVKWMNVSSTAYFIRYWMEETNKSMAQSK